MYQAAELAVELRAAIRSGEYTWPIDPRAETCLDTYTPEAITATYMSCLVKDGETVLEQHFRRMVPQWKLLPDSHLAWNAGGYVAITRPSANEAERRHGGYTGIGFGGFGDGSKGTTGTGARNTGHKRAARSLLPKQLLYDHPQGLRARPDFLLRVLWRVDVRLPTRDCPLTKEDIRTTINGEAADFDVIHGLKCVFEFMTIITCGFIAWIDIPAHIQAFIKKKPLLLARFTELTMLPLNRQTALEDMGSAILSYLMDPARRATISLRRRIGYFLDSFTIGHLRQVTRSERGDKVINIFGHTLVLPDRVHLGWNHIQMETDDTNVLFAALTSLEEDTFGEMDRIYHFHPGIKSSILERARAHDPDDHIQFASGVESSPAFAVLVNMLEGTHGREITSISILDRLFTQEPAPLYLTPPFPVGQAKLHVFWWHRIPHILVTHIATQQQMLPKLSSKLVEILEREMDEYEIDRKSYSSLPANIDPMLMVTVFPHPLAIASLDLDGKNAQIRDLLAGQQVATVSKKGRADTDNAKKAKILGVDNQNVPVACSYGATAWRVAFEMDGVARMHAVNIVNDGYVVAKTVPKKTLTAVRTFLKAHGIETDPEASARNIPPAYQFTGPYDDNQLLYARVLGDQSASGPKWRTATFPRSYVSEFHANGIRPENAPGLDDDELELRPRPPTPLTSAHPLLPAVPVSPVAAPVLPHSSPLSSPPASPPPHSPHLLSPPPFTALQKGKGRAHPRDDEDASVASAPADGADEDYEQSRRESLTTLLHDDHSVGQSSLSAPHLSITTPPDKEDSEAHTPDDTLLVPADADVPNQSSSVERCSTREQYDALKSRYNRLRALADSAQNVIVCDGTEDVSIEFHGKIIAAARLVRQDIDCARTIFGSAPDNPSASSVPTVADVPDRPPGVKRCTTREEYDGLKWRHRRLCALAHSALTVITHDGTEVVSTEFHDTVVASSHAMLQEVHRAREIFGRNQSARTSTNISTVGCFVFHKRYHELTLLSAVDGCTSASGGS
jgi:hypothetical protein